MNSHLLRNLCSRIVSLCGKHFYTRGRTLSVRMVAAGPFETLGVTYKNTGRHNTDELGVSERTEFHLKPVYPQDM
jgi:hypothetical protein